MKRKKMCVQQNEIKYSHKKIGHKTVITWLAGFSNTDTKFTQKITKTCKCLPNQQVLYLLHRRRCQHFSR